MKLVCAVILSGILHNCIRAALSCSPIEGWMPLEPTARVQKADIVIYGTVRASPLQGPKTDHRGFYSALFEVHCSLKGGMLPQFINVSEFGFVGGLCTTSAAYLNKTYIAFIRRKKNARANSTRFIVDEVNTQSATIKENKSVLKDIMKMVGKSATLPLGATKDSLPGCPEFHFTRRPCRQRSHKHKKRRPEKCRVASTPSTQISHTKKELTSSRKRFTSSKVHTKATLLSTTTKRQGNVDFLFQSYSTASRMQSICWCFVLIFHSLVLAVVKWHQT